MSIENFFADREFFCRSRIFFVDREFPLSIEKCFSSENFPDGRESAGVFAPKYDHMGHHMVLKKMADYKGVLRTGQQPFPKVKSCGRTEVS